MIQHEIFQRALVGFNNLWIHFILREFNCVTMSKIPSPIIQMEIWARYLGGCIFWFTIIFLPLSPKSEFFAIPSLILSHLELSRIELPKLTLQVFNGNFAILSRQVISHKKMVVSIAKFTILISCSPICIPLILLLALMKLARNSAAIMYKSIQNRHPWQTSRMRVKGSDGRPFILILDWILVYTSLSMWMVCLHIQTYAKQKS